MAASSNSAGTKRRHHHVGGVPEQRHRLPLPLSARAKGIFEFHVPVASLGVITLVPVHTT